MFKTKLIAAVALLCSTLSFAQTTKPAENLNPDLPTLWIIGDSTVRNNGKDQQGWGDPLKSHFDSSKINVVNKAIGGRSSRTFRTEGRWQEILDQAKAGDFVLMQFGHNDPAPLAGDNRERGTIRSSGDETEEVTLTLGNNKGKKEVVHSYGWYMRAYVREAREKGMTPVVLSYVPRAPRPDKGKPAEKSPPGKELSGYPLWSKQAAEAEQGTFIDLMNLVLAKYDAYSAEEIKQKFFCDADYTHTNKDGAALNAQCVVDGLKQANSPLTAFLKTE